MAGLIHSLEEDLEETAELYRAHRAMQYFLGSCRNIPDVQLPERCLTAYGVGKPSSA